MMAFRERVSGVRRVSPCYEREGKKEIEKVQHQQQRQQEKGIDFHFVYGMACHGFGSEAEATLSFENNDDDVGVRKRHDRLHGMAWLAHAMR